MDTLPPTPAPPPSRRFQIPLYDDETDRLHTLDVAEDAKGALVATLRSVLLDPSGHLQPVTLRIGIGPVASFTSSDALFSALSEHLRSLDRAIQADLSIALIHPQS